MKIQKFLAVCAYARARKLHLLGAVLGREKRGIFFHVFPHSVRMSCVSFKIDRFRRYQRGMKVEDLFPIRHDGLCACGCGRRLPPRKRRWFDKTCLRKALTTYYIIKGDTKVIREELYRRDQGKCRRCGMRVKFWEADHILSVCEGGGGCGLENFQTLCERCHSVKTAALQSKHKSNVRRYSYRRRSQ